MNGQKFVNWAIIFVVVIGIIALCYLAANALHIAIPPIVYSVLWIIFIVVIIVLAIKFIYTMATKV